MSMSDKELLAGLRSLDGAHPFVKAVVAMQTETVTLCTEAAAQPNLTSEGRHYNAGRLALALDVVAQFEQAMEMARRSETTDERR